MVTTPVVATTMLSRNSVAAVSSAAVSTTTSPAGNENSQTGARRVSDTRRCNKPIMEKRRRARINNCLNELKTLILDAMKKDPARHSKLEKADILEMTVKHLQNLQRQQNSGNPHDANTLNKFRAGFAECATEVGRFPGVEPAVKRRLLQHLANCLAQNGKPQEVPQVQVHILPNNQPQKSPEQQVPQSGIILSNGNGTGVKLVPTRLPNGDIALVLPATAQNPQVLASPVPLLVPIVPERTASAASAGSYSPGHSTCHSPEPMDTTMYSSTQQCPTQQKPLSLVVRKREDDEHSNDSDDQPWRPW